MRKNYWVYLIILVLVQISSVTAYTLIAERDKTREADFSIVMTDRLYDAVESELSGPINLSKAMADGAFLKLFCAQEEELTEAQAEERVRSYLAPIKESGDYDSAFFISDQTKRYYCAHGIDRMINPGGNRRDIWYSAFLAQNTAYDLDVDTDAAHDDQNTIFVNARCLDEEGNVLGVTGVGVRLSRLQNIFREYEEDYKIKINLVDKSGLVQADVDTINVEASYVSDGELKPAAGTVYTQRGLGGYVITKYIRELDWFLVVQCEGYLTTTDRFFIGFLLWSAVAITALAGAAHWLFVSRRQTVTLGPADESEYDELTGLPNGNYFRKMFGKGDFHTMRYKTMAVLNLDGFTATRENGEAESVLLFLVDKMKELMGESGEIFRWDQDEFTLLMEWSPEFSYELLRKLCAQIEQDGRSSISAGVTEIHLSDSVEKNYYRAKQGCYLVKEVGGNGVKRI